MCYKNLAGFVLLLTGFAYCLYLNLEASGQINPSGKQTILIAHWQGERGCREALQQVIDDYNKLHPETYVRQQIIVGMGSSFTRWCVTQLIGGTPPDIMEYHPGLRPYLGNYFVGLGDYAKLPNPYNHGTDLANVPWRDTFYDGMYGSWEPQLLDYYSVPNTLYTQRFYYNKDLFRQATGSDTPPQTMAEFIADCKKLQELGVIPVVVENAKGEQGSSFFWLMLSQVGWTFENDLDFNHDGRISPGEFLRGFRDDDFRFSDPRLKASLKLMRQFADCWGQGFNAIDTTVAPFMFIQQKGACYMGGSWLGRQMLDSCKFDLGYFPLPLIGAEDPIAGKYYCGPWGENSLQPGMSLAVSDGPNQEIAVDFLQFLTTRKNNSTFNAGPAWVPGVRGADIDPAVKAFEPLIRGKSVGLFSTRSVEIEFRRIMQNFLGGNYDIQEALADLQKVCQENGIKDNLRSARDSWRRLPRIEELRYDLKTELSATENQSAREKLHKRLRRSYESQVNALNQVYAVFGTAGNVKE